MKKEKRNGWLEFCRFVFSLCIVCYHAILLEDHDDILFISGFLGVEFFYIVTGFFLLSSVQAQSGEARESNAISEAFRRLKKVFPYFLVAWVASFIISHILHAHNDTGKWLDDLVCSVPQLLFLSMFDLAGGHLGYWDYVNTGWYLSSLLFAILAVYPLMKKFKASFPSTMGLLIALVIYGSMYFAFFQIGVVNHRASFIAAGNLRAVAGLCLGSFCYYCVQKLAERELSHRGKIVFSIIQILTFAAILYCFTEKNPAYQIVLLILSCLLIIFTFGGDSYLNTLFSGPLFPLLGKFSMIVFVTQSLAWMYPWLYYPKDWNSRYYTMFLYVILLSLANAAIVWLFRKLFAKISFRGLWRENNHSIQDTADDN